MKITDAQRVLKEAVQARITAMLWGSPGIGKSSIVKQTAKDLGVQLIDLRLPQLEPTDLRGIPMPNKETGLCEWYYPSFFPRDPDSKGILFLDELEKAPVSVKNAALELCLDFRVGNYILPAGWSIVCAGNREDDGCFSQPLGSALCNRMLHLEVEADLESWIDWAKSNGIADDLLGYIQFRPEHLYKYTGENAFPTPRSWEMASTMFQRIKSPEDTARALTAIVGKATAAEFRAWNKVYRDVNVEDIIVKGKMPKMTDSDASGKYAVAMAVAHYVKKAGVKGVAAHSDNIAKFMTAIQAEMRVVFCKQLTVSILQKMCENKSFKPISSELMKIAMS